MKGVETVLAYQYQFGRQDQRTGNPTEEAHRVEVQRAQDPVLVRPVWGA